ncbi:MAG: hypothetical protein AAGA30_10835 [Planctomycetota bacterium]
MKTGCFAVTVIISLLIFFVIAISCLGFGPNIGLPIGYYGKFNRMHAHIESNTNLEVVRTSLHRDLTLEDFYFTVRTRDGVERRLKFEGADTRSFSELLQELE